MLKRTGSARIDIGMTSGGRRLDRRIDANERHRCTVGQRGPSTRVEHNLASAHHETPTVLVAQLSRSRSRAC
jgi:hypothetical protein